MNLVESSCWKSQMISVQSVKVLKWRWLLQNAKRRGRTSIKSFLTVGMDMVTSTCSWSDLLFYLTSLHFVQQPLNLRSRDQHGAVVTGVRGDKSPWVWDNSCAWAAQTCYILMGVDKLSSKTPCSLTHTRAHTRAEGWGQHLWLSGTLGRHLHVQDEVRQYDQRCGRRGQLKANGMWCPAVNSNLLPPSVLPC